MFCLELLPGSEQVLHAQLLGTGQPRAASFAMGPPAEWDIWTPLET